MRVRWGWSCIRVFIWMVYIEVTCEGVILSLSPPPHPHNLTITYHLTCMQVTKLEAKASAQLKDEGMGQHADIKSDDLLLAVRCGCHSSRAPDIYICFLSLPSSPPPPPSSSPSSPFLLIFLLLPSPSLPPTPILSPSSFLLLPLLPPPLPSSLSFPVLWFSSKRS